MMRLSKALSSGWLLGEEKTIPQVAFWFCLTTTAIIMLWADKSYDLLAALCLIQVVIISLSSAARIKEARHENN